MAKLFTGILFAGLLVGYLEGCSLPGYLMGDWVSSDVGAINFNGTAFGPYTVGAFGDFYFECYLQVGTKYIVKSTATKQILSAEQYFYLCLDLRYLSANKYRQYLHTASESAANNQRVKILPATSSPTEAQVCDDIMPEPTYFMLLKNGTSSTERITCPDWFLTTFNYTSTDSFGSVCIDNTQVYYNTTSNPVPILGSTDGLLSCMYYYASGSTNYLTLYNEDAVISTSLFVCMVSSISGSTITFTPRQDACGSSQTPLTGGTGPSTKLDILSTCPLPTQPPPTPAEQKNSASGMTTTLRMVLSVVLSTLALLTWTATLAC